MNKLVRVSEVKPLDDYQCQVKFEDGTEKIITSRVMRASATDCLHRFYEPVVNMRPTMPGKHKPTMGGKHEAAIDKDHSFI